MYRNISGQTIRVFAFNLLTSEPVLGDAPNITCKVSKDDGPRNDMQDQNPDETEDGYYIFNVNKGESDGTTVDFYPESSTPDVQVITVYHNRYTVDLTPPPCTPSCGPTGDTAAVCPTDFQDLQDLVGPKRVKTKEVEIEAHRLMDLQALQERRSCKPVTLGQFPLTMVKPKCEPGICNDDYQKDCCQ